MSSAKPRSLAHRKAGFELAQLYAHSEPFIASAHTDRVPRAGDSDGPGMSANRAYDMLQARQHRRQIAGARFRGATQGEPDYRFSGFLQQRVVPRDDNKAYGLLQVHSPRQSVRMCIPAS
jgi:hypothetical protein